MKGVLSTLFLCIRDLAIAIRPIIPSSADKLLDTMGIAPKARNYADLLDVDWYLRLAASGFMLSQPMPIFPRLELLENEEEAAECG